MKHTSYILHISYSGMSSPHQPPKDFSMAGNPSVTQH